MKPKIYAFERKVLTNNGSFSLWNHTKIFGSPNNISHSAICAEAEVWSILYRGILGYRDYDLARTKYLLIWGCDPLSSNRQVPNTIDKFSIS
jgi:hypothetical protein